jgi:restriction system protein
MASEAAIWGIHGGRTGDADTLFLQSDCIAIGWAAVGDLTQLKADREAIKTRVAVSYPEKKPGAVPVDAGQLFRFAHEMKSGDFIVYPSKRDRQIHFGRVTGAYRFDTTQEQNRPTPIAGLLVGSVLCLEPNFPRAHFTRSAQQ